MEKNKMLIIILSILGSLFLGFLITLISRGIDQLIEQQELECLEIAQQTRLDDDWIFIAPKANSMIHKNTYGPVDEVEYIVVHSTANSNDYADEIFHTFHLDTTGRESDRWRTSWHLTVGIDRVVQHTSLMNPPALWHAGSGVFNQNSIGIELTEHAYKGAKAQDFNDPVFRENNPELVELRDKQTELLIKAIRKILRFNKKINPRTHIVRHKQVTGKNCPRIYSDDDWKKIINSI